MAPESERARMAFVHFDNMCWPVPDGELEWALRYGKPTSQELLQAASILAAYQQLVSTPTSARCLPKIRESMRSYGK